MQRCGLPRAGHQQGVEHRFLRCRKAERIEAGSKGTGQRMYAQSNALQPLGSVPDRIQAGRNRQQGLRGADVAGRLLATDVLLAHLHGKPQRRTAVAVNRHPHQTARHVALQRVPHSKKGGMRPAEKHRHAETLGGAHCDVGAQRARRAQHRERQRITGHHQQGLLRVQMGCQRLGRTHRPETGGILEQGAEGRWQHRQVGKVAQLHGDAR